MILNFKIFKKLYFWFVFLCVLLFALFIYYSIIYLSLDQKDIYEIILFPLIIQPIVIVVLLEVLLMLKDLRNEDHKKLRLSKKQLLAKYSLETPLTYGDFISESVPLVLPKKKLEIDNIKCTLKEESYNLPAVLFDSIEELFKAHKQSDIFNSQTLSLREVNYSKTENVLNLSFILSDYFSHAFTNLAADIEIQDGISIRDLLEPGPKLFPLKLAKPSNHLGLSTIIETSDKKIVLTQRSSKVSFAKNQLSPSVSGALTASIAMDENMNINLKQTIVIEAGEELSTEIEFGDIYFLGLLRELNRLGKPEIFFYAKIKQNSKELKALVKKNPEFNDENKALIFYDIAKVPSLFENESSMSTSLRNALILTLSQ